LRELEEQNYIFSFTGKLISGRIGMAYQRSGWCCPDKLCLFGIPVFGYNIPFFKSKSQFRSGKYCSEVVPVLWDPI